jgi:small redox-active disulfide protein 2
MKIQILGGGCSKCKTLEQHAREAMDELGLDAEVEKVTDMGAIAAMGVMSTPALAVDGVVKSMGKVLAKDQIIALLK